jgi:aerobic-type carbon monoxide dehydrogenase small subunit (CoxS/CutS family)
MVPITPDPEILTMSHTLNVNGKDHTTEVDGDMPLLWFLRDTLELTGTKYGCGMGLCGACTVHLDGEAVHSCLVTVSEANGKKVTTIEGLSEDGSHPLQIAWLSNNVSQCGYCQPGQIMKAADLLRQVPAPSVEDIDAAMEGNLCRCGTYLRVRKAIADAAGQMKGGAK